MKEPKHTVKEPKRKYLTLISVLLILTFPQAHHGMNSQWEMAIDFANTIVTGIFVAEMLMK